MGKGLANALLIASREAFRGATPIDKVTTPGFLQYLLGNNKPDIISTLKDDGSGYLRDVKIRYRTRGVPGKTVTTDNCSIQVRPAYQEYSVPATSFRALGIAFEDDQIAKFEQDALAQVSAGTPAMTGIMKDIYEAIIEQANGLFADINIDLLAVQAANFGKNVVPGNNNAKTINFVLNSTNNPLNQGMTEVTSDAMANEVRLDGAIIVGSGLVNNYYLQQTAKSHDQAGVNTSQLALPRFYYDHYAQSAWGANQFGLFEKNAVQFVNTCRFRGAKAGQKGSDFFMTLRLPITDSLGQGSLSGFEFDVQLTYRTCPGELQIGPVGEENPPVMLGRGWNIILMSSYQTVNIPNNSYAAGDRLNLVNGTFRYTATNA
ncbi:hypothetical protein JMG10_07565 [Nostoc ellipsosporum NOK]|nr:hypothetical protein [Nostoc ellipsosporum NOK]